MSCLLNEWPYAQLSFSYVSPRSWDQCEFSNCHLINPKPWPPSLADFLTKSALRHSKISTSDTRFKIPRAMNAKVFSDAARVPSSQFSEETTPVTQVVSLWSEKLSEYLSESSIRPYLQYLQSKSFFFNTFLFNARKNKISNNLFQNFK